MNSLRAMNFVGSFRALVFKEIIFMGKDSLKDSNKMAYSDQHNTAIIYNGHQFLWNF